MKILADRATDISTSKSPAPLVDEPSKKIDGLFGSLDAVVFSYSQSVRDNCSRLLGRIAVLSLRGIRVFQGVRSTTPRPFSDAAISKYPPAAALGKSI